MISKLIIYKEIIMYEFNCKHIEQLPKEIEEKVHQGHVKDEFDNGIVCNYKRFSIVLEHNNEVIGVLTAYTAFAEIYIDDIWVDPLYRGSGYGRKLLHKLEEQFKDKGYNNINLVTSQFQAPNFYKKCGFIAEFIRENQHNPKLTKIFFIKYFSDNKQYQGIIAT